MGESFFQRWSRRKAEQTGGDKADKEILSAGINPSPASATGKPAGDVQDKPLPTLEDVTRLTRDSDYSIFVSEGVDQKVRRAAMKKLFADPHFHAMDGLDIYIDDYTKPSPLTPAMLAALRHTQPLFEAVAKNEQERKERDDALASEAAEMQEKPGFSDGKKGDGAEQMHDSPLPLEHLEERGTDSEFSLEQARGTPDAAGGSGIQ